MTDPTREELASLGVTILPGTDVEELVERFRIWQAITHGFVIDNPMTPATLDRAIEILGPRPGERAIDIPGGRGELLCRLAERGVAATGVDISPWVIRDAALRAADRGVAIDLVLGDGKAFPRDGTWDLATSLGGSWIWNGTQGTLHALRSLLDQGGRAALGDLILRDGVDPVALEGVGVPLTRELLEAQVEAAGLTPLAWIAPDDDAWRAYTESCVGFARTWTDDRAFTERAVAFAKRGVEEFEAEVASFEWIVVVMGRQADTR